MIDRPKLVIRRGDPGRGILALDRRWFEHAGLVWVVEHPCESGRAYRRWEVRLGVGDDPAQDGGVVGNYETLGEVRRHVLEDIRVFFSERGTMP